MILKVHLTITDDIISVKKIDSLPIMDKDNLYVWEKCGMAYGTKYTYLNLDFKHGRTGYNIIKKALRIIKLNKINKYINKLG